MTTETVQEEALAKKSTLSIAYNGVTQQIAYQPHEQVKAILERAMNEFGITQQRHLYSLFRTDGSTVPENESAQQAGLVPGSELYLRQDQVKGGDPC